MMKREQEKVRYGEGMRESCRERESKSKRDRERRKDIEKKTRFDTTKNQYYKAKKRKRLPYSTKTGSETPSF